MSPSFTLKCSTHQIPKISIPKISILGQVIPKLEKCQILKSVITPSFLYGIQPKTIQIIYPSAQI